jgi:RecA/RadA recombinase
MGRPKKNTESKENDFFTKLAEDTGGKVLKGVGSSKRFFDTGNLATNYICSGRFIGGGIPTGITEFYGPPSTAKSLWGYTVLGLCQRTGGYAILLDCERSSNEQFAVKAGHVNENQLVVHTPIFFEEIQSKITNITTMIRKAKGMDMPIVFLWDSIGVAMTKREWNETKLPQEYTAAEFKKIVGGKEQPGERAKAAGKVLRTINPFLDDNNASMVVINQTRASIGTYGKDETTAGGGNALGFYANCRIRTAAALQIIDKKREMPIGVNLKVKNKKSRSFVPMLKTEGIQLYFDRGINPISGLLTTLINAGRIETAGKGYYKINDPWACGKEAKFQASKENNLVPIETLLEFPVLVDAKDTEELKDYLETFGNAVDLIPDDGDIAETAMENDDIDDDDKEALAIIEGKKEED